MKVISETEDYRHNRVSSYMFEGRSRTKGGKEHVSYTELQFFSRVLRNGEDYIVQRWSKLHGCENVRTEQLDNEK